MHQNITERPADLDAIETAEWLEALDQILDQAGPDRGRFLLERLAQHAKAQGVEVPTKINTPYMNTIPVEQEVPYPGDRALERRVKSLVRWNAMSMVTNQNRLDHGIGGHISTYASLATILEVGFNHFFRASYGDQPGDFIYFQGHASPGVYARAFVEGRLSEKDLANFRHELRDEPGLSSYPHPWLMQNFWSFPTVSMGLGPISSLYQARFMRYLENRGLIEKTGRKVWAFLGDGETDEPESLGSLTLGSREKLDNLIFVVNCNLQRLDGPVRGNGKIIQELEAAFRGAGWNVIKCIWGCDWDELFAKDTTGKLLHLMEECVDGEYQAFKAKGGAYVRKEFFGRYPETAALVADWSDEQLTNLHRGGHDPKKVYNAFKAAMDHKGGPSVVLAKTVKGYGLGDFGEGRNYTHQQKELNDKAITYFRSRFDLALPEEALKQGAFYRPPADSPEISYMHARRKSLGGYLPSREVPKTQIAAPALEFFSESLEASKTPDTSTTMAFVKILTKLLKHPELGKRVVPIIPDEARTFGMESLFRQFGIYASGGQLYKPHDADILLYYKEAQDGQILEEGITEAGSMASFTAAGTAYANYKLEMIPFFIYYSMFGFQRVGDQIWAFADSRGKGFLMGGTAGRTTLAGEGLQHQDGHSLLLASTVPSLAAYDPTYPYEIAVIVRDGIRRMYQEGEDLFYYICLYNGNYAMAGMPEGEGIEQGIVKGIYKLKSSDKTKTKVKVQLLGSGSILPEVEKAAAILEEKYSVSADVWSVTSYSELRREALAVDRWNRLRSSLSRPRFPYIVSVLGESEGPIVAASDYMKAVQDQISPWLNGRMVTLGTDGFGRSDNREHFAPPF